ncbi:MAG: 30S ribosomal protein S5 [Candidatus Paceibacterota bacterium]|jgi:small subunit ribosomal protein S5
MDKVQNTKPNTGSTNGSKPGFLPRKPGFSPRKPGESNGRKSNDRRGGRPSFEKAKPEFDQKIISIRRVTRVVSGGRRFSFSVAMVIGDRKGSVGLGTGKAGDTALAIGKALRSAKKSMIKIRTTKEMSIPHDVEAKFCASVVMIMPNRGKGMVAGSSVRDILNLAGVKNVTSKVLSGSKNKYNTARATMKALSYLTEKVYTAPIIDEEINLDDIIPENLKEKEE